MEIGSRSFNKIEDTNYVILLEYKILGILLRILSVYYLLPYNLIKALLIRAINKSDILDSQKIIYLRYIQQLVGLNENEPIKPIRMPGIFLSNGSENNFIPFEYSGKSC